MAAWQQFYHFITIPLLAPSPNQSSFITPLSTLFFIIFPLLIIRYLANQHSNHIRTQSTKILHQSNHSQPQKKNPSLQNVEKI